MKFDKPVEEAVLLRRYKRFLADVETADGDTMTVHCANSGSMKGCDEPGSAVIISDSENPKRKLRHTLELVRVGETWVGVNTALPNHVVREGVESGVIEELAGYDEIRPEVKYGEGSRVDLLLTGADRPDAWVEIKNVSLAEDGTALFPDAVTARGLKHLRELEAMAAAGDRAVMFFLVNREDCRSFAPAEDIDADYAEGLRRVADAGVEVLCYAAAVTPEGITVDRPIRDLRL